MVKQYLTALFLLLGAASAQAQITVAEARATAAGTSVTVTGTVTNGNELGQIRYLQDNTGGIAAYFQLAQLGTTPINRGDSILVTGVLKQYNNLLEFDPITSFSIIARRRKLPDTVEVTAANASTVFNEAHEGQVVRINGLNSILTTGGQTIATFGGNTNYNLNGQSTLQARINSASAGGDTGLVGKPAPTGSFDIIGIMSQFCSQAGCQTGYQLLPRLATDIQAGPAPNINSRVNVVDIQQNSLTLSFTTQNPGDTRLQYGTTPSMGQQLGNATQSLDHNLVLQSLTPGTVYYVRAVSQNPNGTSTSPVYAFATQSQSTGKITSFFTHSVDTRYALPGNNAVHSRDGIADSIVTYINKAVSTIDIAIYNFGVSGGHALIVSALNNAANRGVQVRLIAEGANANTSLNNLSPSIRVLRSPEAQTSTMGIMHNKFMIIDAESTDPNKVWLWTGSTNWTDDQLDSDYNNAILFQDQAIARSFKVEFEEMWGSSTSTPGAIYSGVGSTGTARFGAFKADNTPHELKIGGKRVEMYFSPSDQNTNQIVRTIRTAKKSLQFSSMTFTRTDIAYAIRDKVDSLGAGNCARGLVDDTTGTGEDVAFRIMYGRMGSNLKIYTRPGIFHHKYMVVDQDDSTGDPRVLTGSHNWSTSAETRNDENTVIVHDRMVANQFFQEFAARFGEMGGTVCGTVAVNPSLESSLIVFPNPATETLRVQGTGLRLARLTDAMGRVVLTSTLKGTEGQLNVKGLANGIYLLQVQDASGNKSVKVSIER